MSNLGWIKIDRAITSHWIWQDAERLKWWMDMLMVVNYEDKKTLIGGSLILCKRGQSLMSIANWAKRWKTSKGRVLRFFELLESDGMIERKSIHKTTQLTICNYECYQDGRNDGNTDNGTMAERWRNDCDTQLKKDKEYKEKKNDYIHPENSDFSDDQLGHIPEPPPKEKSCAKKEKAAAAKFDFKAELVKIGVSEQTATDWMDVRRRLKASNSETAFNQLLKELRLAWEDGYKPEDCIAEAVARAWKGYKYEWMKNNNLKTAKNGNSNSGSITGSAVGKNYETVL